LTTVELVITVQRMAFVWSRLALAAVLAAGAACAPAETCPELAKTPAQCDGTECDGPKLVCSESAAFVLFGDGLDDGSSIPCSEAGAANVPRIAVLVDDDGAYEAPVARGDVLLVAPKTSPPRT
jgi:hypothetical protein